MARALFLCCDFSSWHCTTVPVGSWVIRTAESVVLTLCPPGPDERASARRAQVGTGERSEKIRTYNYPQSRITDHRAGVTLHRLEAIIEGDLDEILDAVLSHFTAEAVADDAA